MFTLILSIVSIIAALVTALLVVLGRHKSFSNLALSLSLAATACVIFGDSMSMFRPGLVVEWKMFVFVSEAFMVSLWLLFVLRFARGNFWDNIHISSKILIFLSPLLLITFVLLRIDNFFYSPEFERERVLFLDNSGYVYNLLLLFYSIISVIALETTLRSSSGLNRWNLKYTLIGVGGILAINVFYYSRALLYRSLDMNLLPVRAGVILISIILISYSLIKRNALNVEVTVSRKVFYRSLSIVIIGFYLLGLGLIGEGMRYFGPKVGGNITTFIGFAGAMLVLMIILSEKLRRKTLVFISKNFYSQKYDYRDQWLKFTRRISLKHSLEDLLGAIAEGFQEGLGVKGAAIWLKEHDSGGYVCVKTLDIEVRESTPERGLVDFFKDRKWILDVHDAECGEIVADNVEFIAGTKASLIVPLLNVNELEGFIVLGKSLAEDVYNFEDYDLLKTLASQATAAILNAKLSEELTEAKEMEAIGRLSSFIIHDLKNAASMLSMVVQNAEDHMENPEFQKDAIRSISNTSSKMNNIIEKLKNIPEKKNLFLENADLGICVKTTVNEMHLNGNAKVSFIEEGQVDTRFDREEISKVVVNLIINALDATDYQGEVKIAVGEDEDKGFIRVSDNGCGMSREFIEKKLFRPFQTTKRKGLGIGLYQCKTIVDAHSGQLKVISEEGKGTDFFVYLPKVLH